MRAVRGITAGVLAATLLAPLAPAEAAPSAAAPAANRSQVVLDWERTAFTSIFPATPIPVGVPILGFTAMVMYDAARASLDRGASSETAAVATAAHHVLSHYVPAAQAALDAQLEASLATVPDGPAESNGVEVGQAAAEALLASRAGDGFGDPSIHYTLPPGIGVWQPAPPATDMLAAWLASLRPLVLEHLLAVDGPDALTSDDYTRDYNEVKRLGSVDSAARTQAQTDNALFFNSNSAVMVPDALVRRLEADPLRLRRTARIFAAMHAAMADTLIKCWQQKRDVGFWRPSEAIAAAGSDGNPDTAPQQGWAPLVPNPPYAEYPSGHGCLTAPAVEVIRQMLGEQTTLELQSVNFPDDPRTYTRLSHIERDARNARIWSGLHFRDAMVDAYSLGHRTARRVIAELD